MTFKSLVAGLCATLAMSASHAEITYSVVHGQNLDLYYDASAFGSDVTANGDSFFFKNSPGQHGVDGFAYVVAHDDVALYGGYSASLKGSYETQYGQYIVGFSEATIGFYYNKNPDLTPIQKNASQTTGGLSFIGTDDDYSVPVRSGPLNLTAGGAAVWSDKAEFGRIDMKVTLFAGLDTWGGPPGDYGYLNIDGYSFNFETVSLVPEPETYAMLLGGLALLALRLRRRQA
jgi:hypothetical protein